MATHCYHSLTVRDKKVQVCGCKSEIFGLQILPNPIPPDHCMLVNRAAGFIPFWLDPNGGRPIFGKGVTDDDELLVKEAIQMLVERGELDEHYDCFHDD